MRLLTLPDYLRKWGLEVETVPGWERRGKEFSSRPKVVIGHHTATPASRRGDLPSLKILRDGRSDLPGPLCQVAGGRSGRVYVIAAGKANHGGPGDWKSVKSSSLTVGIEMEHPGDGSSWNPHQLRSFDLISVALLDMLGQKSDMYCGHREWANPPGRKPDPRGVDLNLQRARLQAHLLNGPVRSSTEEDDMKLFVVTGPDGMDYSTDLHTARRFKSQENKNAWVNLAKSKGAKVERISLTDDEFQLLVVI